MSIGVSDGSDAAANFTIGGVEYTITGTGTVSVTGHTYGFSVEQLVIPSKIESDQYTVTAIGDSAFFNCDSIKSVEIPNTVTSIGKKAFYNNYEKLETVKLDNGSKLKFIGESAFDNCKALKSIDLEKATELESIGEYAFYNCWLLGSLCSSTGHSGLELNINLKEIGTKAFSGCKKIESVTIPSSVTTIGQSAFESDTSLETVNIENNAVGESIFNSCTSIKSVTFSDTFTSIGINAFGSTNFYDSDGRTRLTNATDLKGHTFTGTYPNLIKVGSSNVCGYGVTYEYDSTTNALTISKTGEGDGSMYDYYAGSTPPWDGYKDSIQKLTINSGVTTIGVRAFTGCTNLNSVTIANTVTSIKDSAFSSCQNISGIAIPDSVTTVGDGAFSGCGGLTSVTLGSGINKIANQMFYNCSSLGSITIPDSVTSIGSQAFSGCSGLRNLTICGNLTEIGSSAFYNCHDVTMTVQKSINDGLFSSHTFFTGLVIASGVETIGTNAFLSCSSLVSVTIEENSGLETIGGYAFQNCASLKSINLEKATVLETISEYAFAGCKILGSVADKPVTIPSSVKTIGTSAFYDCDALKSVTIPSKVKTIETYAFSYCDSLETVTIISGVKKISHGAFSQSSLTSLIIPSSVVTIENNAFNGITFYDSNGNELDKTVVANLAGYTFKGTDGTTLTRIDSPTTYVVSYDSDGGSVSPGSDTVNQGSSISLPDPGTKTGYSFAGWYTSIGTKVGGSGDSYTPQSDITLYAHWTTGETYTVRFVDYDGTVLETHTNLASGDTVTYGGTTPTRLADEQYTYTFKGWDPEIAVVTGDATYTATYDAIPIIDPDTADDAKTKGLDANGQFLLVTFGAIISLTALALIITRKR